VADADVSLKLRSGFGAQATGGTGSALWEAGLFLCDLIARQPEKFAGRRVLELGAGNGLTGVVFARMTPPPAEVCLANARATRTASRGSPARLIRTGGVLPAQVVLTDHTEPVLALMEHNLRLNGVAAAGGAGGAGGTAPDAAVRVQPLDWEVVAAEGPAAARGRLAALCGRVDVVVGADISFDPALIAASLGVLRAALEGGAALALLATTIRNPGALSPSPRRPSCGRGPAVLRTWSARRPAEDVPQLSCAWARRVADTFTFLLAEAPRQGLDVTEVERHADGKPPALFAAYPEVRPRGRQRPAVETPPRAWWALNLALAAAPALEHAKRLCWRFIAR